MDVGIPKNPIGLPSELSKLASRREPNSLFHLWKRTLQAQNQGIDSGNSTRQLAAGLNRALGNNPMASSGYHPFQIYQLPQQYRDNPQPNDWLRFRCRNGNVTFRPMQVMDGSGTVNDFWEVNSKDCKYSTEDDDFATGIPSTFGSFSTPPFTDHDELFMVNGYDEDFNPALIQDPEYLIDIPSSDIAFANAVFWISIDFKDEFNPYPVIHFGGSWTNVDLSPGGTFGDDIPPQISGLEQISLQNIPNIMTSYRVIGFINIIFAPDLISTTDQTHGQPIVSQVLNSHVLDYPIGYMNFVGTYDDNPIYWPGDMVYFQDEGSGDSAFFIQYWYDAFTVPDSPDRRQAIPLGVSGIPPNSDLTSNQYWLNISTPGM